MDLLLLALRPMIFPDPGMQRVFVHSELARGLRASLLRLDGQFDCALLEFSGILSRRGLAHRTHLVYCVSSLSPCVRKSITTSFFHDDLLQIGGINHLVQLLEMERVDDGKRPLADGGPIG